MLFEPRDSGCKKTSVSRTFDLYDSGNRGRLGLRKSCENALLLRESRAINKNENNTTHFLQQSLCKINDLIRLQTRCTICVSGQKKIGVRCPLSGDALVISWFDLSNPTTVRDGNDLCQQIETL